MHTAVKISPQYSGAVVYVLDASRSVPVVQSLLDRKNQVAFSEDIKEQYAEMREVGPTSGFQSQNNLDVVRAVMLLIALKDLS